MDKLPTLTQLGWRPFFQQQLTLDELSELSIARVVEQHRSGVVAMSDQGLIPLSQSHHGDKLCVGDWVLFDAEHRVQRCFERQSLFQRKAPGSKLETQLIAANVDCVWIVSSLNQDFSLSRIERYLALAKDAEVEPVIILTKADLCEASHQLCQQVQALDPMLVVFAVNALNFDELQGLMSYCREGQTLALLGSSGVGKSTLVNSLMGSTDQVTASIREDDSKGRHTTTYRSLKWLPHGGLLMDTPGMRELQLSDCEHGVNETFTEIIDLAKRCRFADCSHSAEPGCAVRQAIEGGSLDSRRYDSYQKLLREQAFNASSLAEKRAKDKAFGKMIHHYQSASRQRKKRD